MKTVERQLAAYFDDQEETYGPISPTEVTVQTATPVDRLVGSRRIWVWAATAALLFLAVGSIGVFAVSSGSPVSDSAVDNQPATADIPGAENQVEFNGRTFSFDQGGPANSPYRLVEQGESGGWTPVEGFNFEHPISITASDDQMMVVSPSASAEFSEPCEDLAIRVGVTSDGEAWHTASLQDIDSHLREQDSTPRGNCFTMGGHWLAEDGSFVDGPEEGEWMDWANGGDAVGLNGMLIVRVVTRCCVDPAMYPHFWYSPNGVAWQRADLPYTLLWSPYDFGSNDMARRWGAPSAEANGFTISSEEFTGEVWEPTRNWSSTDGLGWVGSKPEG